MPILTQSATYEDLCQMPEDGRRWEIHEGELREMPSPDWSHQDILLALAADLRTYVLTYVPGGKVLVSPLDIRLSPHNVYQPDIVYISPARRHILGTTMPLDGAPDLVMEILSPSTRLYDQREKARVYAQSGILEFWVVDPAARTIEVFALRDGLYSPITAEGGRAVSLVLPGFSVDPIVLFADS